MHVNQTVVHQGLLVQLLKSIFPNEQPLVNAQKVSNLRYSKDDFHYLELDAWFPNNNICFEFQDSYHYVTTWYNQHSLKHVQSQDFKKIEIVQRKGMTMIVIPCWWDGTESSLCATINFHRPDIIPETHSKPIPFNPPSNFFQNIAIPHLGELMYVSIPKDRKELIGHSWWLGEKYDGVRCCWVPSQNKIFSRQGNEFLLLNQFTSFLPSSSFLDGEFWFGRGQYSLAYMLINNSDEAVSWHLLRIIAFDVPETTHNVTFEKRYKQLIGAVPGDHPFIRGLDLNWFLSSIIEDGGEGVIMQRKGSLYEQGRSSSLVKLKMSSGDTEAIVITVGPSSVLLQLPHNVTFNVPQENIHVPKLKIGDVVTFSYDNYSRREIPVDPKIIRIRTDISWEDIINQFNKEQPSEKQKFITAPMGHWTTASLRVFLENFAKERKMDPKNANTWYNITSSDFVQDRVGRLILQKFKGYINAVHNIFPEIQFDNRLFATPTFDTVEKRRRFFENYARDHSFDSLVPDNWYLQMRKKSAILNTKGAAKVLFYHNNEIPQALIDLFPEIGLDKSQLHPSPWTVQKNRRRFFEKYAKENGFDPTNPEHWYLQPTKKILQLKGAHGVLAYHGNMVSQALLELFPEIGFDKTKLLMKNTTSTTSSSWHNIMKRREFFIEYSKKIGFDPFNPENWYSQPRKTIMSMKGAHSVLSYHNNKITTALIDLFPQIGLEEVKFTPAWNIKENRKHFFEKYALIHGFDSLLPENWHRQPRDKIMAMQGVYQVMSHHNYSIDKALNDLFQFKK